MIRIARVAAGAQKELDIAKTEMVKIAKVATAAQKELDIARGRIRLPNKVINGLQQRLDSLEGRESVGSDLPGPGVRLVVPRLGTWTRSGQSPRPRRPAPVPEPIPTAGGRYGGLRDQVPGGDVEWDIG